MDQTSAAFIRLLTRPKQPVYPSAHLSPVDALRALFKMHLRLLKSAALLSLSLSVKADPVTVVGSSGVSYLGVRSTGQDAFLGVPYAKPPTGSLRFRPPQAWAPTITKTLVNATVDKPICVQSTPVDDSPVSEDCLYLSLCRSSVNLKRPDGPSLLLYREA